MNKPLKSFSDITVSSNARAPQADITNAPHLFGDIMDDGDFYGDIDDDYDDDYGDIDDYDYYGDPDIAAAYEEISGDPLINLKGLKGKFKMGPKGRKIAKYAAIAGGATGVALGARHLIRKRKKQRAAVQQRLNATNRISTIERARIARRDAGALHRGGTMSFFNLKGATFNKGPLVPNSSFVTDTLKALLDYQATLTPFYVDVVSGVYALGTWTITAAGPATARYFIPLILQFGTNVLNAAPSTIVQVTLSLQTLNGPLVVAAPDNFVFTYDAKFNVRFIFFPWQMVSNKPLPVVGTYGNGNSISMTITGIAEESAVNLVVPGPMHEWVIFLRNSLLQGGI